VQLPNGGNENGEFPHRHATVFCSRPCPKNGGVPMRKFSVFISPVRKLYSTCSPTKYCFSPWKRTFPSAITSPVASLIATWFASRTIPRYVTFTPCRPYQIASVELYSNSL